MGNTLASAFHNGKTDRRPRIKTTLPARKTRTPSSHANRPRPSAPPVSRVKTARRYVPRLAYRRGGRRQPMTSVSITLRSNWSTRRMAAPNTTTSTICTPTAPTSGFSSLHFSPEKQFGGGRQGERPRQVAVRRQRVGRIGSRRDTNRQEPQGDGRRLCDLALPAWMAEGYGLFPEDVGSEDEIRVVVAEGDPDRHP